MGPIQGPLLTYARWSASNQIAYILCNCLSDEHFFGFNSSERYLTSQTGAICIIFGKWFDVEDWLWKDLKH